MSMKSQSRGTKCLSRSSNSSTPITAVLLSLRMSGSSPVLSKADITLSLVGSDS